MDMISGTVFNIQRFSTDDGEGIRTCVFLKGCPLRCVWCHNAEGLSFSPELAFYENSCIGCGACCDACPQGAIEIEEGRARMDRARCVRCGRCADVCPTDARCMIGKEMTVEDVMEIVRRDRVFYGKNGGLTITGGEPMAQAEFTVALARAAKSEGISVAVETSGYGREADFLDLLPYCDLFLFDCKASKEDHETLIGVEDDLILGNLKTICERGATVRLRCPMISELNLNDRFLQKIIRLSERFEAIQAVQLMPYHATGIGKNSTLGKPCEEPLRAPDRPTLLTLSEEIGRGSGKKVFF